ncbi:General stress protein 16O [Paraliobacillus sp. PM-2]|uniref:TraR/DksA C4-type zinc finger protein n=1 Tax=Paraliobacillus sp. PM-2 TaxID=1462524 RepID=UPI00061B927C|nr:TraR/DksA C4-type zinc finger protein [Paraliobacillus sp. PM-2]CQR48296.1 General stress protein 16O [Paraliobacillus sp. PM-2]
MLTQQQVTLFKKQLMQLKKETEAHLADHYGMTTAQVNESVGELSNYDNHPGDTATELYEREKDIALNEHSETELKAINQAIKAIEQGTYGQCAVCRIDIPIERLEALPTTLYCVDHTEEQSVERVRPVEEDILDSDISRDDEDDTTMFDAEDAWQRVGKYGSSETPSDFYDTEKTYQDMFFDSDELVGSVEELEGFLLSDRDGKFIGVNERHEHYEDYLDDQDVNSIMYD